MMEIIENVCECTFWEAKKSNFGIIAFLKLHLIFSSCSIYLFGCVLIKILNRFIINVDLSVFFHIKFFIWNLQWMLLIHFCGMTDISLILMAKQKKHTQAQFYWSFNVDIKLFNYILSISLIRTHKLRVHFNKFPFQYVQSCCKFSDWQMNMES